MDDEEEMMCLLSEHEDCGAGIAAAIGGQDEDEQEHDEVKFAQSDQPDPKDPNQMRGPIDSDIVMVVNDIISDIEDKPCSGLPTSRSLPTAIHGYDCDEDDPITDAKEEDGSGAECHRCVSPRPSSMSFRGSRASRGGEPLIVDVHLPPQRHAEQQQVPPSVPLRPCKHAINRSQKCISDVTNIKTRPKDDGASDEMSVSGVSQNESNEVFDKIETVTEHPTATHFPVNDSNGASTSMGTNSLESFKNRFRFASESAASFVLHNLPASIKAGFDFKETKDTFHHHNHSDKIDINHDESIMEQLMQYNGNDPSCPDDFPPNSPAGSKKSKYTKVPTENMDYYDIGDYDGYGGTHRGQGSSMGQYQDLPQNDPFASMGSIGSPAHHNFHKDDFENGCGLSQSSSIMSMPVCRICQLPSLEPSNPLISPCRCLGSIRYVHNNCLLKWLEVSSRRRSGPPCCELCQYPYLRHKKFVISNWRYPECSLRDKILHSFFLFCIIMMIGCAAVTITCFKEARWPYHPPPNKYQQGELSPPEMISLLCAILFFSAFFLAMYVELKAKHTVYQLLCKFFYMNHEWSVEEYDRKRDIIAKKPAVDTSA